MIISIFLNDFVYWQIFQRLGAPGAAPKWLQLCSWSHFGAKLEKVGAEAKIVQFEIFILTIEIFFKNFVPLIFSKLMHHIQCRISIPKRRLTMPIMFSTSYQQLNAPCVEERCFVVWTRIWTYNKNDWFEYKKKNKKIFLNYNKGEGMWENGWSRRP